MKFNPEPINKKIEETLYLWRNSNYHLYAATIRVFSNPKDRKKATHIISGEPVQVSGAIFAKKYMTKASSELLEFQELKEFLGTKNYCQTYSLTYKEFVEILELFKVWKIQVTNFMESSYD